MINITSKVKASKMDKGSFIDIPTKFVKSAKHNKQRTIQVKSDGSYYYSSNPFGNRMHLYMIEIKAAEGFYIISEELHQKIKRVEKHGKTTQIGLDFELCELCTVEPKLQNNKYCSACKKTVETHYMSCSVEDIEKPYEPI